MQPSLFPAILKPRYMARSESSLVASFTMLSVARRSSGVAMWRVFPHEAMISVAAITAAAAITPRLSQRSGALLK